MRIYRALLHLYPASFRAEYGDEICAILWRSRREISGPFAVAVFWLGALAEIVVNAAAVHWDILRQDLRYAARSLGRARGFALTTIVLVALGVGANTAAFSVTDFVLVRPLPYPDAASLVRLWERKPGYPEMELSPPNYRDWKRLTHSFAGMGFFFTNGVNLVARGEPERVEGAIVSADLLPTLDIQPAIGRGFTSADEREGASGVVILSHGLWKSAFAGDAGVLGKPVTIDDRPAIVVGVMPASFSFPSRDTELWLPAQLPTEALLDRNDNILEVVARLKPGVTLAAARSELDLVAEQLRQQYPKENEHSFARVNGFRDELSQQSRLLLLALTGASLCVLLIVCANIANLLLARALGRRKEIAVRTAIGAGRERLIRQLGTESLVLTILGGSAGVLLAVAIVPLLGSLVPAAFPAADVPSVDTRTLLFALILTAATGMLFGLAPVLRTSRGADFSGLHDDVRSGGGRKERLRSLLVVAEVVASVVLLISSGLLLRAMWSVQSRDPGFRTDNVLTLRTALPFPRYEEPARRAAFYSRVLTDVRALPGVANAAYTSGLPMVWGGGIWGVGIGGDDLNDRTGNRTASLRFVTPGFFATMGIPLRMGRDVAETDTDKTALVAVVSESFVRRYWPDQDPLGRHFKFAMSDRMVVGVVGDVRVRGLERQSEPQAYLPYTQQVADQLPGYAPKDLAIKASAAPDQLIPAIRAIIRRADPQQPISDVRPMSDIVEANTASRAIQLRMLVAFAAIAFLLAGIGIHGLLSFTVSQRTPEIGVRMALGAQRSDILAMILKRSALLTAAGIIPGVALAYAAGRGLRALLAGIAPGDPATFAMSVLLIVLVALAGTLLPTLRALHVDAMRAIRTE